jgi:hypothetical protein
MKRRPLNKLRKSPRGNGNILVGRCAWCKQVRRHEAHHWDTRNIGLDGYVYICPACANEELEAAMAKELEAEAAAAAKLEAERPSRGVCP